MQIISRRKTRNGLCLIKYDNEDLEKQFVNLDQEKYRDRRQIISKFRK